LSQPSECQPGGGPPQKQGREALEVGGVGWVWELGDVYETAFRIDEMGTIRDASADYFYFWGRQKGKRSGKEATWGVEGKVVWKGKAAIVSNLICSPKKREIRTCKIGGENKRRKIREERSRDFPVEGGTQGLWPNMREHCAHHQKYNEKEDCCAGPQLYDMTETTRGEGLLGDAGEPRQKALEWECENLAVEKPRNAGNRKVKLRRGAKAWSVARRGRRLEINFDKGRRPKKIQKVKHSLRIKKRKVYISGLKRIGPTNKLKMSRRRRYAFDREKKE